MHLQLPEFTNEQEQKHVKSEKSIEESKVDCMCDQRLGGLMFMLDLRANCESVQFVGLKCAARFG